MLSFCGDNLILNIQQWDGKNWNTVGSYRSETISGIGNHVNVNWTHTTTGTYYFRASFDGSEQYAYAPCVSGYIKIVVT